MGSVVTASGQAALHLAITTILSAGGHIVSSRSVYGGTHNFEYTMSRFGISTTFVDPETWLHQQRDSTQYQTFGEVLGNPGLKFWIFPRFRKRAHHLPLLIDATFVTPYLCQPIELGADLVVHSARISQWYGVVVGGVVVDGGTFDWQSSDKFPTLSQPYVGFHNLVFADEFGPAAFITRARKEGIRDFGACMAPMTAFQILQGLETLPLRMQKHVTNALEVAAYLEQHAMVESVSYPGLPSHPDYELAQKMLPKGCGAVFSFEIKGGRDAGRAFIESLNVFSHLANVGDAKSLVIHPASTTHHRVDEASLLASGIGPGLVRLSVGLEDAKDLINDLKAGLRVVEKMHKRAAQQAEGVLNIQLDGKNVGFSMAAATGRNRAGDLFVHGAGMDHSVWVMPPGISLVMDTVS